ncbi:MAG: lysM domain protein [Bacteroidetes bacterium]|nr:lysM domain protein [Bacteroidota bacterium]
MANQSLSDLTTQLQNAASGNANNLVFSKTTIAGSFNYQAVLALVGQPSFTVSVPSPTTGISYNAGTQTMTVSGTCNFYGLGNAAVTITMTGADVPSANCLLNTTFASLPLSTLATYNLIPSSTVSNAALTLFPPFNNVSLAIAAPTTVAGNVGTYTLTVGGNPSATPIPLIAVLGLSLSSPGLLFVRNATKNGLVTSALTIYGNVNLGSMQVAVSLQAPVSFGTQPNIWTLNIASGQGTQALSLENLIQVLAGGNPFTLLPASFSGMGGFALLTLTVKFDFTVPLSPIVSSIFVNIGTGNQDWPVVSTPVPLTITDAGVSITVTSPFDKAAADTQVFIYGGFIINKGGSTQVILDANAMLDVPSGDWVFNISGNLQTNGFTQLFGALPLISGQTTPPDMPNGMTMTTITLNYLTIGYNASASSNSLSQIAFSIDSNNLSFPIIPNVAATNPYAAFNISNPTSGNFQLTGTAGGTLQIGDIAFALSASKPAVSGGWTFAGTLEAGNTIDLQDLVNAFMTGTIGVALPSWITAALPTITALDFSITTPPASNPTGANSYSISGAATWGTLTLGLIQATDIEATVTATYDAVAKAFSGSIVGTTALCYTGSTAPLINIQIGYTFAPGNNDILLMIDGIICNYNTSTNIITISFSNTSLGKIISNLMSTVEPGFQLSFPWTFLNDIDLSGLSMTINMDPNSPNKGISLTYSSSIDLGFLKINSFTIAKKDGSDVTLAIDGSFLGLSTSDPASQFAQPQSLKQLPAVPGQGNSLFQLNLLAMGQHVAIQNASSFQHVNDVITALGNIQPATGNNIPLQANSNPGYDPNSSWLIATNFGILQIPNTSDYSIAASVVFNDPNIYGLQLTLSGDRMKFLAGLSFEIMYKKISDTVGLYQIDFTLPAAVRNLSFGEFNVVIPSFGLQIYTNGDFLVDIGFPYNLDFSRSFTVSAIIWVGPIPVPVLGSAGFYFGKLSSATCPQVPQSTKGTFNPVIVFGIGMQIGLGYTADYGILSVGFSLTVLGILEGIIATWQPYAPAAGDPTDADISTSHYYWIKGTVGIMGKMWGSIDFAIIKATLDITIYATVSTTYESYKPMPFSFTLSVSVTLSVKINLGLFSITIHFSFSITLHESLTVGSDHSSEAPWYDGAPAQLQQKRSLKMFAAAAFEPLVLQSTKLTTPTELNVYFIPHLTITGNEAGTLQQQAAQYIAMLYMDTIPAGATPTGSTSFEILSLAVFNWVTSSSVQGAANISAAQLQSLYDQLSNGTAPMSAGDITTFLEANFILNIQVPDTSKAGALDVTVFPAIPSLQLSTPLYNGQPAVNVDFSTFTQCDSDYVSSVQTYFSQMAMQSTVPPTGAPKAQAAAGPEVSVGTIVYQDYFMLIARQLVKAAIDAMDDYKYTPANNDSLASIVTAFNNMSAVGSATNDLTIAALVSANSGTLLGNDVTLQVYGVQYAVITGDTLLSIAVQFGLPVSQLVLQNLATASLLTAGVTLTYNTTSYATKANDTFTTVATAFGVSLTTLATTGCSMNTQAGLLNAGISITAGTSKYVTAPGDTLASIAQANKITVSALALANTTVAQLLAPSIAVFCNGSVYVTQPADTLASVALRFGTDAGTMTATVNTVFSNPTLLAAGANVLIAGARYQVQATDTLGSIQTVYNGMMPVSPVAMLLQNRFLPGLILANVQITIGQANYTTVAGDTLSSIINNFPGVDINTLAAAMQSIPNLLRAQSFFYIPPMSYTTAAANTTDTFQTIASRFQTQPALLGSVPTNQVATGTTNSTASPVFASTANVLIPNLQTISISLLSAQVSTGTSIVQSSGMVSRYLMHGLRLPVNSHITFAAGAAPCGTAPDCALYNLTGQQFTLPVFTKDDYVISLTNPAPSNSIYFNGVPMASTLTVTLQNADPTETMIASVLQFAQTTGVLPQIASLVEYPPYAETAANFTFRASVPWQTGATLTLPTGGQVPQSVMPEIWSFPPGLIQSVNAGKTLQPLMIPYLSTGGDTSTAPPVSAYGWGTLLNVTIRQSADAPPFCYELVGADEAGTLLLQNLLSYMDGADNSVINDIAILYPNSGGGAFLSDGNSNIVSFLLQSNLSTVTNPPTVSGKRMLKSTVQAPTGILNGHYNFVQLLWECSITRSGGFYIYYNVFESGTGLPDQLFKDSSSATINIFVTYQQQISGGTQNYLYNFMNSLVTGVSINPAKDVVYAQSQLQNTTYTVAAPASGGQNTMAIADIVRMYNVLPSDLVLDNPTIQLNTANLHIDIPGVYYQMKNGDTLASVATYFTTGGLNTLTGPQLQTQNPGVTPGPWALLYIGDITLVTGTGGPVNTLAGVLSYYNITADAFSVANLSVPGIFANNSTFSISDQLVSRTSVLPAGSGGYWMQRTIPGDVPADPTSAAYPNLYLQNAYNQLAATVLPNAYFAAGTPGMPVGPSNNDPDLSQRGIVTTGNWQYSQAIPLNTYALNRGMLNVAGLPPAANNPYAGTGNMVQINLDWRDLFGNNTVTPFSNPLVGDGSILNNIPVQVGYTDNVIAVSAWPSIGTYYVVNQDPSNNPQLELGIIFDPTRYIVGPKVTSTTAIANAKQDIVTYTSIYYQLCQVVDPTATPVVNSINAVVGSSLMTNAYTFTPAQFNSLLGFVQSIYLYLSSVINTTTAPVPGEIDFMIPLPVSGLPSASIFEVTVSLSIVRPIAQVHHDFKDVVSVWNGSMEVQLPTMANNSNISTLQDFAFYFEKAMATTAWKLKIATGMPDVSGSTANGQSIWAIQWGLQAGQNLSATINNTPVYFAVAPLANCLQSDPAVPVSAYTTGSSVLGTPQNISISGVDMDTWASNCLNAIETMLSPQYAAPMYLLGQLGGGSVNYTQQLLGYKQSLAMAIKEQVTNILAKDNPIPGAPETLSLKDAKEQMYQQVLNSLTNAYSINAVIQFPAAVSSPYPNAAETIAPNIYGVLVTSAASSNSADPSPTLPFSLSTAKVALDDTADASFLTFMFNVNTPGNQSNFEFNIEYQVTHLEHDIETVPGITTGYLGSQWLNFVIQPPADVIGGINVPVLLRAYPTPPSTFDQTYVPQSTITTLAEARLWDYEFTYASSHEAQDLINVQADFNLAPQSMLRKSLMDGPNLLHALAEFNSVYPAILQDMNTYLLKVTRETQTTDAVYTNAVAAVTVFNQIIANIAIAWPVWQEVINSFSPVNQAAQYKFPFNLAEGPLTIGNLNSPLVVTLGPAGSVPAGLEWPLIQIDGNTNTPSVPSESYQYADSKTAVPLAYLASQSIANRLVRFPTLDILAIQNAWASVSMTRNSMLIKGLPSNNDFVYQTPYVGFAKRTIPLLSCDDAIDISTMNNSGTSQSATLLQHMTNLFTQLFSGDTSSTELIKLSCSYFYSVNDTMALPEIQIPVLLATPFPINIPSDCTPPAGGCPAPFTTGSTFVCTLTDSLQQWFTNNTPATLNGYFLFTIAIFSKIDPGNQLPVLQLNKLTLSLSWIQPAL